MTRAALAVQYDERQDIVNFMTGFLENCCHSFNVLAQLGGTEDIAVVEDDRFWLNWSHNNDDSARQRLATITANCTPFAPACGTIWFNIGSLLRAQRQPTDLPILPMETMGFRIFGCYNSPRLLWIQPAGNASRKSTSRRRNGSLGSGRRFLSGRAPGMKTCAARWNPCSLSHRRTICSTGPRGSLRQPAGTCRRKQPGWPSGNGSPTTRFRRSWVKAAWGLSTVLTTRNSAGRWHSRSFPRNTPPTQIGRASCRDGAWRSRHTRCLSDWSSDVCSSDLVKAAWGLSTVLTTRNSAGRWHSRSFPRNTPPT